MPFTVTVTVSREPAPLGPSISEVDSVRRSLVLVRSVVWYEGDMDPISQEIGVSSAPPMKSSAPDEPDESGVEMPFIRRPLEIPDGGASSGRGKTSAALETDITRSKARR